MYMYVASKKTRTAIQKVYMKAISNDGLQGVLVYTTHL